jgi:hypothetical protein
MKAMPIGVTIFKGKVGRLMKLGEGGEVKTGELLLGSVFKVLRT